MRRRLIVHGSPTTKFEFTHQVAITDSTEPTYFCGGSMLDATHILTAAHCTYAVTGGYGNNGVVSNRRSASDLTVHVYRWTAPTDPGSGEFGSYDSGSGLSDDERCTQQIGVSTIAVHPEHTPPSVDMDVAVLTLSSAARCAGNEIALVELYKGVASRGGELQAPDYLSPLDGRTATMVGWGYTNAHPSVLPRPMPELLPPSLRKVDVRLQNYRFCESLFASHPTLEFTTNFLCSFDPSMGGAPCSGDSGGPLTLPMGPGDTRPVQVGIVSFSLNNATHSLCDWGFGAYSRVAAARWWILEQQHGTEARTQIMIASIATAGGLLLLAVLSLLFVRREVKKNALRRVQDRVDEILGGGHASK